MATLNATNLKHASSGSNNIVLGSDGSTTISNLSGGGKILQVVQSVKKDATSAVSVARDTNWTGHGLSVSITPSSASSKIYITGQIMVSNVNSGNSCVNLVLYKAGSALTDAIGDAGSGQKRVTTSAEVDEDYGLTPIVFQYLDTAGTTSSITYQPALNNHHSTGHTMYVNRSYDDTTDESYIRAISVMTAMEISA